MKNTISSGLREVSYLRALVGIFAMATVIDFASTDALIRAYQEQQMLGYGYHTDQILVTRLSDTAAPFLPILARLFLGACFCHFQSYELHQLIREAL